MQELPEAFEKELVLYYYGEARRPEKLRRRLEADPALRRRYDELCQVLAAVEEMPVPDPGEDYGARVYQRLRPRLQASSPRPSLWEWLDSWLPSPPRLATPRMAVAGALASLLVVAFLAGRYTHVVPGKGAGAGFSEAGRERLLLVEVSAHLERSERLLVELTNLPDAATVDLSFERHSAESLVGSNRLYRQMSRTTGREDLAVLLDELERILLELARSSDDLAPSDFKYIRERTDEMLFKVQIVGSHLRQEQTALSRDSDHI